MDRDRDASKDRTLAQQISARYGDDGLRWTDVDGVLIRDALETAGARCERKGDLDRWTLPDGSVVTIASGAWDLGYTDCYCWQGAGHDPDCDEIGG